MNILIKFPSRGRPDKFKSTLSNHLSKLSGKNEVKFVFSFDVDDKKMNNDNIRNFLNSLNINCSINYGHNQNKIQAINADLENENFDVLILIADDMIPLIQDYDEIISDIFSNCENGLDSTIHFNTTRWGSILDIWCIMGKKYYDRFNYIYHPDYKSIFCDNEYTEIANKLNRKIYSEKCLFEHDYITGDDTEVRNWKFNSEDWSVYEQRKLNNFFLFPSDVKIEVIPEKNNKVKKVNYLGYEFEVFENDGIGIDIIQGKIWEKHIISFLKNNLEKNMSFVDVGSHYGCHSLIASNLCEMVYSFEPQKKLHGLQKNTIKNNSIKNIKLRNIGLSNKNEKTKMNPLNYENDWINSGDVSIGTNGEEITLKTLDSFKLDRVGIIKVDVQGFEKFVLEGAKKTIEKFKPTLIVEFEEGQLRKFGYGSSDLFDYIRNLGYHIYFLEYVWPSDHVCVHKDNLSDFINKNEISMLDYSNDLNYNLENNVTEKITTA